jgi:hypothetical protein
MTDDVVQDQVEAAADLAARELGVHGPGWRWVPSALIDAPGWFSASQHNPETREHLRGGPVALVSVTGVVVRWAPNHSPGAWERVTAALVSASENGWDTRQIEDYLGAEQAA